MKILVLGDVHSRSEVFEILNREIDQVDLVIFLGDFVSTHARVTEEEQIRVCNELWKIKEENPEKFIILRSNHDCQHAGYYWAQCSGYFPEVGKWFEKNKDRWLKNTQWIYLHNNLLFSHAGVSAIWMENNQINSVEEINDLEPSEIFGFTPEGWWDTYGQSKTQPPTWIRPESLCKCAVKKYTHIVGHTPVYHICNISAELRGKSVSPKCPDIWCVDCLPDEYLIIEDENFIVKTYESRHNTL